MIIILNGEDTEVTEGITVEELLEEKDADPKKVIVEVDGVIYQLEDFKSTVLKEGSVVEVLRFVGGG